MSVRRSAFLAPVAALAVLCGSVAMTEALAQSKSSQKSKSTRSKSSDKSSSKSATAKSKTIGGRLPAYFGQVGLKDEQRQEVYEIQASYREKIEALEKELADLRAKMNKDLEGVLTTTQKRKLSSLRRAGSSSESSSSSKSSKSRSTGKSKSSASKSDKKSDK